MSIFSRFVALAVLVLGMVSSASAHHSYAGFDGSQTLYVEGTVSGWEWTNPHSFLIVAAPDKDGKAVLWQIESLSPSMLSKFGFSRTAIKVGEKVTVKIHPHRTKPNMAQMLEVKLASGKVLRTGGTPAGAGGAAPAGAAE